MRTNGKHNRHLSPVITVDWGTSSFRLSCIDTDKTVLASFQSDNGIANLSRSEMESFLVDQISRLGPEFSSCPVVMCGMVGSAIGWQEVSYIPCPVDIRALAKGVTRLDCERINALIVPGASVVSSHGLPDRMRGEETQVAGWLTLATREEKDNSLLCLPGTHTKWVSVKRSTIEQFNTAVSGELFALLCEHSILLSGTQQIDSDAFETGVLVSRSSISLVHVLFSVRSKMLSGELKPYQGKSYLSGLIIGSDVNAAIDANAGINTIHIVGSEVLNQHYAHALNILGIEAKLYNGDTVSSYGLLSVYEHSEWANESVRTELFDR